ncbi:C1 family peptidase [candidate division KSB1 bacterium]
MIKSRSFLMVISLFMVVFILSSITVAQDEVIYKKIRNRDRLSMDFTKIKKPASIEEFKSVFHLEPIGQYFTSTCWCFSTTSLLESELYRLKGKKIRLSVMHTVYWEFVEKCRYFVQNKGKDNITAGSEQDAVTRMIKKYGMVPMADYTGLLSGQDKHNHGRLFRELRTFLSFIKENKYWDEDYVIMNAKYILDKYLGKPPDKINYEGVEMTPAEFRDKVFGLNLDDYVVFMSFKYLPFYTRGEYTVPDNWWHSENYYNVPLDDFCKIINEGIKDGFSASIGGDVSEPGLNTTELVGVIPSFDVQGKNINQDSREFRFNNRTSTDDHAIHLVGYKKIGKNYWYLIKDSGGGSYFGYPMYRDDYVKLKILTYMIHKDAAKDVLKKFVEE